MKWTTVCQARLLIRPALPRFDPLQLCGWQQVMNGLLLYLVLPLIGVIAGAAINWAIATWRYGPPLAFVPWSPRCTDDSASAAPRPMIQYLPIIGWLTRWSEESIYGKRFWLRPLLIELFCGLGLPLFYRWQQVGMLVEPELRQQVSPAQANLWFVVQAVLMGLMLIATFIDFDERTIPDRITVPGTLIALAALWFAPTAALPYTQLTGQPTSFLHLRFNFPGVDPFAMVAANPSLQIAGGEPNDEEDGSRSQKDRDASDQPLAAESSMPAWLGQRDGLLVAWAIVLVWGFALAPKTICWRHGVVYGLRLMWASLLRPARRTKSKKKYHVPARKMLPYTKLLVGMTLIMLPLIGLAWWHGGLRWYSLFSAIVGMGFGGLTVWSVRILGSFALQREAMGFGDVTLLAMIGAFLGWQPAFLAFVLAPFSAIFIAIGQLIVTRRNELAFGPYLCLGTVILLFGWVRIWNAWAGPSIFVMGSFLLVILLVSLLLIYPLLAGWRWLAYRD